MAGDNFFSYVISGVDAMREKLLALAPLVRRKYAMKALKKGAAPVAATAIAEAPRLAQNIYRRGRLYRKPGTLKAAIRIRSSKDINRTGDVGVIVNVKPAKGAARGANSPDDAFYWKFTEFGTKYMKARRYLRAGAGELESKSKDIIERELAGDFRQMNLDLGDKK